MRQIRNQHTKATNQHATKHVNIKPNKQGLKHLLGFSIQQFDTTMGFINRVESPILLKQCMNSLQPTKHKLSPVKTSPRANLTKRTKHAFSPITIPGTPETPVTEDCLTDIASSSSTGLGYIAPNDNDTDDELGDIDLYYKAFNKHRPEPGESNAEAMTRHQAIEDDYQHLKERYKVERKTWKT
jgi:hypothetical protein